MNVSYFLPPTTMLPGTRPKWPCLAVGEKMGVRRLRVSMMPRGVSLKVSRMALLIFSSGALLVPKQSTYTLVGSATPMA